MDDINQENLTVQIAKVLELLDLECACNCGKLDSSICSKCGVEMAISILKRMRGDLYPEEVKNDK